MSPPESACGRRWRQCLRPFSLEPVSRAACRIETEPEHIAERVLKETSAEAWKRWGDDRERRRLQREINAEIERREAANLPVYPKECAERIAHDTQNVAPDWRHFRPTIGPAWGRLLKAQPELAPDLTQQREQVIKAVFASVPKHLRESVGDLHRLIDLMLMAHEAAAYLVGFEAGRLHTSTRWDSRGRGRQGTERPPRREQRKRDGERPSSELRLTLAE